MWAFSTIDDSHAKLMIVDVSSTDIEYTAELFLESLGEELIDPIYSFPDDITTTTIGGETYYVLNILNKLDPEEYESEEDAAYVMDAGGLVGGNYYLSIYTRKIDNYIYVITIIADDLKSVNNILSHFY